MLIFVKSNVTLSSWMLWSTLIFDGDGTPHSSACNDGGYGWILWSTLIFGGIGTPLLTQQLTWWFKVHLSCLSRKAHVSRAILISKLECWWTKFNVELSLIKLRSKVLTIALRTTKLNCKVECWSLSSQMLHSQVECCDLLWFLARMELHTQTPATMAGMVKKVYLRKMRRR